MDCQDGDDKPFFNENDEDIDIDEWTIPDKGLIQKMVKQIEYYLSDENLAKDAFLLKHVRRNKMGYVNIKLLTSFKKMKQLTKDWRTTAYALRHSSKLEVNEEGNKVRRLEPVPDAVLSQVPSKVLLVWNVSELCVSASVNPADQINCPDPRPRSTIEIAISLLEPFGAISTVRVNRPGRELPSEVQRYSYRYPELSTEESVLVEYEELEGAGKAYHELTQPDSSVKIVLVGRSSKKKKLMMNQDASSVGSLEERTSGKGMAILNRRMEQLQSRAEDSSAYSSSESEFASSSPLHVPRFFSGQVVGGFGSSPWGSPRSSPRVLHAPLPGPRVSPLLFSEMWGSPDTSPELSRRRSPEQCSDKPASTPTGSPWVQRRKLAVIQTPNSSSTEEVCARQNRGIGTAKRALNGDSNVPHGVLRFPYGPDGTRGFHLTVARRFHHPLKILMN
ncbi:la-related protein 6-like [Alosa sapidissima]|uniref:la-related protein 6-like n=1 Tax=Alosa sapidissima TaxID=34773 RepID=UPI001C0A63B2|nr:la-related protein 6-like [Alosa sapidissima]